jgi:ADP-ribose pyrophosphatase
MAGWKLLSKKEIYSNAIRGRTLSSFEKWKLKMPNGNSKDFIISNGNSFVVVFALTSKNKVVTISQFYYNQLKHYYALCAGFIDKGEKINTTAKRELLEETGYAAKKIVNIGKGVKGKYTTGFAYYCLALGAYKKGEQELEENEDIVVSEVTMNKFKKLLEKGLLPDVFVEACAWRALNYLKKNRLINL